MYVTRSLGLKGYDVVVDVCNSIEFKSQKDGQLLERSHPPRRPKSSHTLDLVMDGDGRSRLFEADSA